MHTIRLDERPLSYQVKHRAHASFENEPFSNTISNSSLFFYSLKWGCIFDQRDSDSRKKVLSKVQQENWIRFITKKVKNEWSFKQKKSDWVFEVGLSYKIYREKDNFIYKCCIIFFEKFTWNNFVLIVVAIQYLRRTPVYLHKCFLQLMLSTL